MVRHTERNRDLAVNTANTVYTEQGGICVVLHPARRNIAQMGDQDRGKRHSMALVGLHSAFYWDYATWFEHNTELVIYHAYCRATECVTLTDVWDGTMTCDSA
ncbi:unnamed protein product [Cylicostephanus goldi]|uniref:Uncharacterized protein n=1 Tax=Cylicostephanus goldi TaxID=71465 RepID=A0A3P7MGG9_CYLGO|nr:unnamed protein product [Cylicostephanus goldi]